MTKWFASRQKGIIHWEEKAEKTKEIHYFFARLSKILYP
jgi:hypothetical protein